jgi:glutaredoxin 2
MKLYHYPHCPFCQRVRLLLGYKNIPYESVELSYADAETPEKLIGQKMLPIIEFDDGKVMAESLDILREIELRFPHPIAFIGPVEGKLQWASMAAVGIPRYFDLLLPCFPDHYQEFQKFPEGKKYFQASKEKRRGKSFEQLKAEAPKLFEENILPHLQEILDTVEDQYFVMGPTFSVADCVLAADLSGMRIVKNIAVPENLVQYIERVEKTCKVNLLEG